MVWYSHLFKNFSELVVIHIVKGFNIVNEAELDVFVKFTCFLHDPTNLVNLVWFLSLKLTCTFGSSKTFSGGSSG